MRSLASAVIPQGKNKFTGASSPRRSSERDWCGVGDVYHFSSLLEQSDAFDISSNCLLGALANILCPALYFYFHIYNLAYDSLHTSLGIRNKCSFVY
jgi:hypothetical protein